MKKLILIMLLALTFNVSGEHQRFVKLSEDVIFREGNRVEPIEGTNLYNVIEDTYRGISLIEIPMTVLKVIEAEQTKKAQMFAFNNLMEWLIQNDKDMVIYSAMVNLAKEKHYLAPDLLEFAYTKLPRNKNDMLVAFMSVAPEYKASYQQIVRENDREMYDTLTEIKYWDTVNVKQLTITTRKLQINGKPFPVNKAVPLLVGEEGFDILRLKENKYNQ